MTSITSNRGARRLLAISIVARLPVTMLGIALLVHVEHLTGSFTAAGIVIGVYAIALGIGGPQLGKLVDRRGQTVVLLASASVSALLMVVVGILPVGAPLVVPIALAAGLGLAMPPLGACLRAALPALITDQRELRAAFALESSAVEATWVAGPPLALGLGALWSTGGSLAAGGATLLLATIAFTTQPASREWTPSDSGERPTGGSLATPAMRTLVLVMAGVGLLFGIAEVAVTGAADQLASAASAGPLMTLWGAGSLVGGLLAARRGGGAHTGAGLALLLGALAAGHLALTLAAGNMMALGAVLLIAGAAIAPTFASIYSMVEGAAPAGTVTEAFAWLATAAAIGGAAGSAAAGAIIDHAGPATAFALAGGAGLVAVAVAMARIGTLPSAGAASVAAQPAAA